MLIHGESLPRRFATHYTRRLPRFCRRILPRFRRLSSEFGIGEPFANDLCNDFGEAVGVFLVLAVVESEDLFIQITV